jgi:hypothetical protein
MAETEYNPHSVVIHTTDTGTAVGFSMSQGGIPLNTVTASDDSGSFFDQSRSMVSQSPVPNWTTKSIGAALAATTPFGNCIRTDGTRPGVDMYWEQKSSCKSGAAALGSNAHARYRFTTGLMVPISLTGNRGADCELSYEINALSDGTNAPVAGIYNAALPASLDLSQYVIGAVKIANLLITDCRTLNLNFGIERGESLPQLGGIWPTSIAANKARPVLTFSGTDIKLLDDSTGIPLTGKTAIHADTIIYFRKRKNRGALEAAASTVHLKLTMSGLAVIDSAVSGSGTAPSEISGRVEAVYDGTNAVLVPTYNVAFVASP